MRSTRGGGGAFVEDDKNDLMMMTDDMFIFTPGELETPLSPHQDSAGTAPSGTPPPAHRRPHLHRSQTTTSKTKEQSSGHGGARSVVGPDGRITSWS